MQGGRAEARACLDIEEDFLNIGAREPCRKVMKVFSRSIVVALAVLAAITQQIRGDDIFVSQFNNAGSLSGWRFDYGGVTHSIEFDGAHDANNDSASGSMKITLGFDAAALNPSGNNKGGITIDLPAGLDGSSYLTMEMDLRIDPSSATDGGGNTGYFQMVIRNGGNYDWNPQFGGNVKTNEAWQHISVTAVGARDNIRGITLELYGGGGITGPVVLYVDNLKFTKVTPARDIVVSRFDDASSIANWRFDYGGVTNLIAFAPSQDASNNPASGSLKVAFGFDSALDLSENNKGAVTLDLSTPYDASTYQTLEVDVKLDPASATDAGGNSGYFQLVVRYGSFYDWNPQFGGNLRIGDGWRHIRIAPPVAPVSDVSAFTIELSGGAGLSGPVTFYVDNLKFTTTNVPPPSPTMAVQFPGRGLNLIPTSGQYQRQNIVSTNDPGYGWVGSTEPVTYSLTIHKYPDASHTGFQTHMFLIPGQPTDSAPDYSQPNLIFLDIQSQNGGGAYVQFRYKVNEPAGNTFLYGAGTLGGVSSPSSLGTWSMTFTDDTNVTVTAPGGAVGNFKLPAAAAALFANPIAVWVGDQPNSGGNIGQTVILSGVRVTKGAATLLDDDFLADENLDSQKWQVFAGDPAGVRVIGSDAAYWLTWTTPDGGFRLQYTPSPEDPDSWVNSTWPAPPLMGPLKRILVYHYTDTPQPGKIYEPSPDHAYFRLFHP